MRWTRSRRGCVVADLVRGVVRGSAVVDESGGVYTSPVWLDGYCPASGESVSVLVQDGRAVVLGSGSVTSRADKGTVSGAASAGLVPVTAGSVTYQARYVGAAPALGALVLLLWQGSTPWAVGAAAAAVAPTPTPDPSPAAPPPAALSGTLTVPATQSGSWRSLDGWGTSSSRPDSIGVSSVVQGTYTSAPYSGAWFYGAQLQQLVGAAVTAIRLRLPARIRVGSYNSALPAHLYAHTAGSIPSGDVSRVAGPADSTVAAGYTGGWVGLPVGWAAALLAGGGVGMYGSPYLALVGLDADPGSGQLSLDWTR